MRCSRCSTQWPDELKSVMKFCGACGAPLSAEEIGNQADQAHTAPPAAHVPASHPVEPGGELRYVTVIFADLADFTAFAENLPPDEVARLVGNLLQRLGNVVEQYGGGVDKFLGDALVATFGLPNPDPNAARNAVRAGLAMQAASLQYNAETGLNLGLRVGIHAGEVMFRSIGGSWTVMGDTVNTASRIQSAALPGKVWISRPVYEEVRRFFTLFARPIVDMKGKKQAVQPYEVINDRQTPFAEMPRFVGRETEWQFLQNSLKRAADEHLLQTVWVHGPAGVGKSRLMWELRDWLQKQPEVYWVDLVQYDTSDRLPSHGLNALLRSRFGLALDLDEDHTLAQLYSAVVQEGLFPEGDSARRAADYFAFILGFSPPNSTLLQLDGKSRWEGAFLTVKDWLERRAAGGMTVWFIEDIQKGDADTAAFFNWALQIPWRAPALIIMTGRDEDFGAHSVWFDPLGHWLQQGQLTELRLREISPPVIALAIEAMADGSIPPATALRIAEHTEGNPLFATEIILLLKERGILSSTNVDWEHLALPGSIREVMEARIERLGLNGKDVAKRGALMGRRFTRDAVARLWERTISDLDSGLSALRETETTYEEASKLFQGEIEDVFRHGRLHEAILARIPREERLKWLKELGVWALDKLAQQPEDHWRGPGLLLIPLIIRTHKEHNEIWLASLWAEVLGDLYLSLNRSADAIEHFRQALEPAIGVRRLVLSQQAAMAAFTDGQPELALEVIHIARHPGNDSVVQPIPLQAARCLDELHDQPLIEWRTLNLLEAELALDLTQAEILGQTGQVDEARRIFMQVEHQLLSQFPARPQPISAAARLWLRWSRSCAYFLSEILSQHSAALEACRRVRQRFDLEEFSDEQRLTYLYTESLVEMNMGHQARALQLVEERLRIARQHHLIKEEANALNFLGNLEIFQGDIQACYQHYLQALELTRQLGLRRNEAITLFNIGETLLEMGELDQSQQICEQYLIISRQIGNRFAEAYARLTFSTIALSRNDFDSADQWMTQALEIARQNGWRRLESQLHIHQAEQVFQRALVEHQPNQVIQSATSLLELEQQDGEYNASLDHFASLVLALCCAGQLADAALVLQRAEKAANLQFALDQAWLRLLRSAVAGNPLAADVQWFTEHHYFLICRLVSQVTTYLLA